MKVVLFCGGMGMRLRESEESLPKPLIKIGYLPILWHVMKYYAHFGHKDFVLCLGYKADAIKTYFLNQNEYISNDFVLSNGGKELVFLNNDLQNWTITFVDTGIRSTIGQRLKAVRHLLEDEEVFLANYSDGLTDLPLPQLIDFFHKHNSVATFLSVKPNLSYHFVSVKNGGEVDALQDIHVANIRINGGFYVFGKDIFNYISNGEDLVQGPFQRLIEESKLTAYEYDGFWAAMDTFKDKQQLEDLYASGTAPWEIWKTAAERAARTPPIA